MPGQLTPLFSFPRQIAFLLLATLVIPTAARAQLPLEVVHTFTGNSDPSYPKGALIQSADGNFYGTTNSGGAFYAGTIFRMTRAGKVTVLHSFGGEGDGAEPHSGVIQGTDGNLYGTTARGGSAKGGTVFRMTPDGIVTVLHAFDGPTDGATPYAGLVQATDGNFYGVAAYYGAHERGTVFRISPTGTFAVVHAFSGPYYSSQLPELPDDTDGAVPEARLIQGADGNLYGTTAEGGAHSQGTAFRLSLGGALTILHAFGPADGSLPRCGLFQASDGNFYGTTSGAFVGPAVVFRMSAQGSVTVLGRFQYSDLFYDAPLIQASDGNLYGVTEGGWGEGHFGSVFRMTLGGAFTTMHSFQNVDGSAPRGALVQGTDGRLYGDYRSRRKWRRQWHRVQRGFDRRLQRADVVHGGA